MGAAKDGPFTPAVRVARLILGDQQLLKLRGKAISCARRAPPPVAQAHALTRPTAPPSPRADHSQFINEFCADYGVPKKVNQALIKKAKVVGSDLGFLS